MRTVPVNQTQLLASGSGSGGTVTWARLSIISGELKTSTKVPCRGNTTVLPPRSYRPYGRRVCLIGNIDLRYTLVLGTPEEVDSEVRDRIVTIGDGGGYILSSANSITACCRDENILAMRDALLKYGYYFRTDG